MPCGASSSSQVFWYQHQNLSEEQLQKLDELRTAVEAARVLMRHAGLSDDNALLRFLQARSWNVGKAAAMYEAMAQWRSQHDVDAVLSESFPERTAMLQAYPQWHHKTDRWGRPVWFELPGRIDVDALLKVTTVERFLRHHIQGCEVLRCYKLPACSAAAGRTILQQTVVLDLAGLSALRHLTLTVQKILRTLSETDQNNFPEHLGQMFIINTPLLFRSFWSVIKGFLDERTLAKIKVLGADYRAELLAVIPEQNLPVQFGGSSCCQENVDVGPWQDPAVVAACPLLAKAVAAGHLQLPVAVRASDSCDSLAQRDGSFIGTACSSGREEVSASA